MELYINKITHYLPENTVPNAYFKEINGLDDEWIYSRTGIKNRSKAGEEENTNTMAIKVVDIAAQNLPYPMEEIDLIVAATYSPYDTVATPAHMIQRRYNMEHAQCLSVSSACSSFINAMEIVQGYFAMGKATKALVIGSEHNSAYANETDPQSDIFGETVLLPYSFLRKITPLMILKSLIFIPAVLATSVKLLRQYTYDHEMVE